MDILIFSIDSQQFAVDLTVVDRVISIVRIIRQPNGNDHVMGVINYHGTIIPVIDCRSLLGINGKEINVNDQLIICVSEERRFGLRVDQVKEIVKIPEDQKVKFQQSKPGDNVLEWIVSEGKEVTLLFNLLRLIPSEVMQGNITYDGNARSSRTS